MYACYQFFTCSLPATLEVVADRSPPQLRRCGDAVDSRCEIAAGPERCGVPPSRYRHFTLRTAEHRPTATHNSF